MLSFLMLEMPYPGEDHSQTVLVGRCYHFFVANRAARLNHSRYSMLGGFVQTVSERKEGVACKHSPRKRLLRLKRAEFDRIDPARLSRSHSHQLSVFHVNYCVRFDMFADF